MPPSRGNPNKTWIIFYNTNIRLLTLQAALQLLGERAGEEREERGKKGQVKTAPCLQTGSISKTINEGLFCWEEK